jgi:hypothetical protein
MMIAVAHLFRGEAFLLTAKKFPASKEAGYRKSPKLRDGNQ